MKKTDYSTIADKYDQNKYRKNINTDIDLELFLNESDFKRINVLDLACGTGLYLQEQIKRYSNENIEWYGIDASNDMLAKAGSKLKNVNLIKGVAEKLPYDNNYFHYIISNYAFHHFENKGKVLDEVKRVLKKDGIFKIHNISVFDMKKWWLYQFFPSAYHEDLKRFWEKELIYYELKERYFEVNIKMEYKMIDIRLKDYIDYVYNRDISVLTIISDKEYLAGLNHMKYLMNKDPDEKILNDFAELNIIAKKSY